MPRSTLLIVSATLCLMGCPRPTTGTPPVPATAPSTIDTPPPDPTGWLVFEEDEHHGFRSSDGTVRLPAVYDTVDGFVSTGIAWVVRDSVPQWIDTTGASVARAFVYDNGPDPFVEGRSRVVADDGRVGFMDVDGQTVIPPTFDAAWGFHHGAAIACRGCTRGEDEHAQPEGGSFGAVDRRGAEVVPFVHATDSAARTAWEAARTPVQRTVLVDPAITRYDDGLGVAEVRPGSNVRSATYTRYALALDSLVEVLGERPEEPVAVVVDVFGQDVAVHVPEDPMVASPDGGFHITTVYGAVVAVAPADGAP